MASVAAVAKAARETEDITLLRYRTAGEMPQEGAIKGGAALSTEPRALSMRMSSAKSGDTVEPRVVGKALHVNGVAEAAKETGGKSRLKLDASALGRAANDLSANSMTAAEAAFLTGAKDVKKVGTETVDGVRTTHYAGRVTLADVKAAAAESGDKAARERRAKSVEQYEKMGVDALTMDMWVDGDHHTKRFRMRGEADKGPLDMTVTVPPAKDTTDLAQLMKDAQG
ncbi:DUF1396 domain-containing protein [Streptomyces sp. W16]|uniref:DUF1396 domain-containing protein n=1 Tax=Streptomyces sp. W16 TaxID=3076631 RepID=UPI00295B31B0|nr:DUF1396 domain-containing protein [Streptomyces sp. W16]MDV9171231.1 DUF1396 domain-containing protein [Streptomyces sp. W16]